MDHTLDLHLDNLNELCRCCGQLASTKKQRDDSTYPSRTTKYATDIALIFDIDIACDEETRHPKYICPKCVKKITHIKRKQTVARVKAARGLAKDSAHLWTGHFSDTLTTEQCTTCKYREYLRTPLWLRKRREKAQSTHQSHTNTFSKSTSSQSNAKDDVDTQNAHTGYGIPPVHVKQEKTIIPTSSLVEDNLYTQKTFTEGLPMEHVHVKQDNTSSTSTSTQSKDDVDTQNAPTGYGIPPVHVKQENTIIPSTSSLVEASLDTQKTFTEGLPLEHVHVKQDKTYPLSKDNEDTCTTNMYVLTEGTSKTRGHN